MMRLPFRILSRNFQNVQQNRIPLRFISISCSTSNKLETKFTFVEENAILKRVNSSPVKKLIEMSFNFFEAEELKKYRKSNGRFKKLVDITEVPSLSEERIEEICDNIVQSIKEKSSANIANVITPPMPHHSEPLKNVVSIMIGADCSITWANLLTSYKLDSWGQVAEFGNKNNLTPHEIYQSVEKVCSEIPYSKVYIFESLPTLMPQQAYVRPYIERKEAQAMLLAILNQREPADSNKVYFMKSKFPMKLFDIKVGNERVSSRPLVTKLLEGESVGRNNCCRLIDTRQDIVDNFGTLTGVVQEAYSNALLLAMTFLQLETNRT